MAARVSAAMVKAIATAVPCTSGVGVGSGPQAASSNPATMLMSINRFIFSPAFGF
jgi:hypothetical protein